MSGTVVNAAANEDWDLLVSFFPANWLDLAASTGALKGLRKDKSPENLLRTLLIHLGCGHSLRETVVRARQASLADLSDVALLKRLRKSREWLYALCVELFREHGVAVSKNAGFQVRAFDATTVREPGRTGSVWRLHYSVNLPSLGCDFFKLTATQGRGTGESFKQFPIRPGDYVLADRGYSTAVGIQHVAAGEGYVTVRVNTGTLRLETEAGQAFDLLAAVETLPRPGPVGRWRVRTVARTGPPVAGRICAVRKTGEAIEVAHAKIRRTAQRKGKQVRPETLRFARFVIVFTTYPEEEFPAADVLEWYRLRWQVELVFKRFKSLAQLGHLPKHDDASAQAWLYGKLLVALLVEKVVRHARTVSPGDTMSRPDRTPSPWRDFKFALNQVTRAIEPAYSLRRMVAEWHEISASLAEPPRRRSNHVDSHFPGY